LGLFVCLFVSVFVQTLTVYIVVCTYIICLSCTLFSYMLQFQ